jgi:hypothetical protein
MAGVLVVAVGCSRCEGRLHMVQGPAGVLAVIGGGDHQWWWRAGVMGSGL